MGFAYLQIVSVCECCLHSECFEDDNDDANDEYDELLIIMMMVIMTTVIIIMKMRMLMVVMVDQITHHSLSVLWAFFLTIKFCLTGILFFPA